MSIRKRPKMADLLALQVSQCRELVLDGRLVCIDPASGSSSGVGWAEYVRGELTRSGVIQPKRSAPVAVRLQEIRAQALALGLDGADLCVVERLRGSKVHPSLHWSSGVLVSTVARSRHIEIPISCWKTMAEADPAYAKGDEADARAMGQAIVNLARGIPLPDRVFETPRRRRAKRGRTAGAGGVRPAKHSKPRVASKRSLPKRRGRK